MAVAKHDHRSTPHLSSERVAVTRLCGLTHWLGSGLTGMLCLLFMGCTLFGGVELKPVATSVQKPSNVALYLSVQDAEQPVEDLSAERFKLFENGQALPSEQSRLTLLNRDLAAIHHTLVLVDMSSEKDRLETAQAVAGFVTRVRSEQGVSVYAFDGSAGIHPAGEFARTSDRLEELTQIDGIVSYSPRDPSRDLHGAVDNGLRELDARLMNGRKPVRVGTLVVFSRGPDVAGRITNQQMAQTLQKTKHHVVTIGVKKPDDDADYLDDIGRAGVIRAQERHTIGIAFEEAATKVNSLLDMHYLISYCSPARAGMRRLRLEVAFTTREGEEKRGSLEHDFDATGFGPGCNPTTPPRFVIGSSTASELEASPADPESEPAATPEPKSEGAKESEAPTRASGAPNSAAPKADADDEAVVQPPQRRGYAPQTSK